MGIAGAIFLTPLAVLFFFIGYQIKFCGRVEWISGVTEPSALQTPAALGNWVGSLFIVLAIIMASGATFGLALPEPHSRGPAIIFVIAVLVTVVVGMVGSQSRAKRKSN